MKTKDAINKFGTVAKLARALDISVAAIYQWGEDVPPLRAYQIKDIETSQSAQEPHADYTGPEKRTGAEPGQLIERRRADNHKEAA